MPLPPDQIRVVNVRPAYDASLSWGVTPDELARLGLPASTMADPDGAVTGAATYAHLEAMQRREGFDRFLVAATDAFHVGSLGIVGLACKTLSTVGEAVHCHGRFQHLTNRTARYGARVEGDVVWLEETRWGPERSGLLVMSDYTLMIAVRLLSILVDGPVPVVGARSRRAAPSTLQGALGVSVETGAPASALGLPVDWLATPVAGADPELAAYFREVLHRAAPTPDGGDDWLQQLRTAIQARLPGGEVSLDGVARDLATSPRTVQRWLGERGTTFAAVRADTQRMLAEGYLAEPDLGLAEVAWLLGYRNDTSFHRAFRRWTGTTPTAWRRARLKRRSEPPPSP